MIKVTFNFMDDGGVDTTHMLYFKTVIEMEGFMAMLDIASDKAFTYTYTTVSTEDK